MRRTRGPLASLIALSILTAACAAASEAPGQRTDAETTIGVTGGQGPAASGAGGPAAPTGTGGTRETVPVPGILRFETSLVGGGTLRGAELAGAPVALWFWAPW